MRRLGTDGRFDWQRGGVLGQGGFGTVYIGQNRRSGELMAVKVVTFDPSQPGTLQRLQQLQMEVAVMKRFRHARIVEYWGTHREGNAINIFMEYVPGGSIAGLLAQFGAFPDHVCASYARAVLEGLYYLHSQGCVHRDIKGANILVGVDGQAKLADFGSAALLTGIKGDAPSGLCGTSRWMAPEVVTGQGGGAAADVWSLGCTVQEMLTAKPPWSHVSESTIEVLRLVAQEECDLPLPPGVSPLAEGFLSRCLVRDPPRRASAEEVYEDWFLASAAAEAQGKDLELALWLRLTIAQLGEAAGEAEPREQVRQVLMRATAALAAAPSSHRLRDLPGAGPHSATPDSTTFPTVRLAEPLLLDAPPLVGTQGLRAAAAAAAGQGGLRPGSDGTENTGLLSAVVRRVHSDDVPRSTTAASAVTESTPAFSPSCSPIYLRDVTLVSSPQTNVLSHPSVSVASRMPTTPGRVTVPARRWLSAAAQRQWPGTPVTEPVTGPVRTASVLSSLHSASIAGTLRGAPPALLMCTVRSYLSQQDQVARHSLGHFPQDATQPMDDSCSNMDEGSLHDGSTAPCGSRRPSSPLVGA